MRVVALREHPEKEKPESVDAVFAPPELDRLLQQSHYVVVCAPLTPATHGLINAARLAAMRADSFLINVGRGPQVDGAALAEALSARRIAGAALDVFDEEPLPADSPLWGIENLLITPHTAGLTEKLWQRHYDLFSANLRRYLAGEPVLFMVDKEKGY
jgi:phosphoglycerate dehydrogenase-like enzyme